MHFSHLIKDSAKFIQIAAGNCPWSHCPCSHWLEKPAKVSPERLIEVDNSSAIMVQ